MSYKIRLEKENFKFSGSHFTIFGPGNAERLHGHNYYVSVELRMAEIDHEIGLAFDFNAIKPLIRDLTASLDEYVLLPENSTHLKIERDGSAVRAIFGSKRYEFPAEDVRILPLSNISSEELARLLANELIAKLRANPAFESVNSLSLGVEETRGQSVYHELVLG
jgi:6-pyruvoyltetrahydropterin/6-carboxytetrahydropterin synthase